LVSVDEDARRMDVSDNVFGSGGGCGAARSKDGSTRKTPRVLVGGGAGFALSAAEHLRREGWDVCTAATTADLHAYAMRKNPVAILIPVEACGESGFLTCAKIRLTRPKMRVVLVGEATPRLESLARFVGAGFATEATAADAVMKLI